MSPFEYVTVLISIVLGLGITQIVTGIADIIHQWNRVKIFWPHLLFIVLAFFLHIQEWWILYALKTKEEWRLPIFLFTILYPILLFVLARILFPSDWSEQVDLKDFYFRNYRKFFLIIAMLALVSILDNLFIQGKAVFEQAFQFLLLVAVAIIAAGKYEQIWLHRILAVVLVLVMVGSFVYNWNEWVLTN